MNTSAKFMKCVANAAKICANISKTVADYVQTVHTLLLGIQQVIFKLHIAIIDWNLGLCTALSPHFFHVGLSSSQTQLYLNTLQDFITYFGNPQLLKWTCFIDRNFLIAWTCSRRATANFINITIIAYRTSDTRRTWTSATSNFFQKWYFTSRTKILKILNLSIRIKIRFSFCILHFSQISSAFFSN